MSKRVAVLLSGCGYKDGSEIHEATCALLALDRADAEVTGVAIDGNQAQVTNHLDGQPMSETRNMMIEAGRIMRGNVKKIETISVDDFDALILPGGFGAATNLCNYGKVGKNCEIDARVKQLILDFVNTKKPVGAICIAPVVVAKALEGSGIHPTLTIGSNPNVAGDIESMGAKHQECAVTDAITDTANKIVTTPAYMMAERISEVESGVTKLVTAILTLT